MANLVSKKILEPEKINIEVIDRLRKFRRDKELSQEKLAAMSGFHILEC
jgi:ribosome-binding protein aMBF1 (putative translation factor)